MGARTRFPLLAAGAAFLLAVAALLAERLEDTIFIPLDHPAILYAGATSDPVGRLAKRLAAGQRSEAGTRPPAGMRYGAPRVRG